mmetsp:Transcript_27971/g.64555  ORF Transcript_27971/g.64555 Transcript_27971/m.64555 type:complete len:202 (-) Transcript_27971:1930-2535(-)
MVAISILRCYSSLYRRQLMALHQCLSALLRSGFGLRVCHCSSRSQHDAPSLNRLLSGGLIVVIIVILQGLEVRLVLSTLVPAGAPLPDTLLATLATGPASRTSSCELLWRIRLIFQVLLVSQQQQLQRLKPCRVLLQNISMLPTNVVYDLLAVPHPDVLHELQRRTHIQVAIPSAWTCHAAIEVPQELLEAIAVDQMLNIP